MKAISSEEAAKFGIKTNHTMMDNGERRFRLSASDGSGYIRVEASGNSGWQVSHRHDGYDELCIVQQGTAIIVIAQGSETQINTLNAGDYILMGRGKAHNTFLFPEAVTHTVKFGTVEDGDWTADPELDEFCKTIDTCSLSSCEASG